MTVQSLTTLVQMLRDHPSIRSKLSIARSTSALGLTAKSPGRPGDDAAILAREGGVDLLAGEGFVPGFVADDPWFAGWCGVMVNLSDIAAMGGHAVAVVDQIWAPDEQSAAPLMQGLRDAAAAYDVPIVGGHTNLSAGELNLAVSVFGRAKATITSFSAQPGDVLIAAIDHRGTYRNFDNFCAALKAPHDQLRRDLTILPTLSEDALVHAGKDISQGGIPGTALMLAECSGVGMTLDCDAIVPPKGVSLDRWLCSFPSFGFLLSVPPSNVETVCARFTSRDLWAAPIGQVTQGTSLHLRANGETALFWDYHSSPYLGLAPQEVSHA